VYRKAAKAWRKTKNGRQYERDMVLAKENGRKNGTG